MKRVKPVTVCICVPVDEGARYEFWISLLTLITSAQSLFGKDVSFEFKANPGDSLITRARNNLVHDFLTKSRADYLLFLDTDLDFSPQDIKRLISHRKQDAVVCGQYAIKQAALRFCHNTLKGEAIGKDGLWRVAEAGTGCMLIPRKILKELIENKTIPEYQDDQFKDTRHSFFDVGVVQGRYLSEDWLFCRRVRQLGYSVLIDTEVLLGHHGWTRYPLPDSFLVEGISSRCINRALLKGFRQDIDKAAKSWTRVSKASSAKRSRKCSRS